MYLYVGVPKNFMTMKHLSPHKKIDEDHNDDDDDNKNNNKKKISIYQSIICL